MRQKLLILLPQGGAAGPTYTITAAQGSYTLTGKAVAFKVSRKLVVAQGSYTLTGNAAAFKAGRKLAAVQGTYALTGQAVAFKAARHLTVAQGSYTLTGQSAGLSAGRKLVLAQGAYVLSGRDASFLYTPNPPLTGRGNWSRLKGKRKGTVIRRSDFESIEAYKASLSKLFPVEPKTKVIEPVPPLDDDDDAILLAVVSRLLH